MADADERARIQQYNIEHFGIGGTFDLSNIDETSEEEIEGSLGLYLRHIRDRGQFYGMNALSFMTYNRPDIAKLAFIGINGQPEALVHHPSKPVLENMRVCTQYIRMGWESGIYNEFRELQMRGLTKAQILEIVMFAQTNGGGIRSMGHVHNAVGKSMLDWQDGTGLVLPEGWEADPDAFKSGLDLTTGHLTEADRTNLLAWYESTIGWVPSSVQFGIKYNPRFLKAQRAKWEAIFKTLPKQVAPYLMLAQHTVTGFHEGLREGALLAKAWGVSRDWAVEPICGTAFYFMGLEGLAAPMAAIDDILEDWDR